MRRFQVRKLSKRVISVVLVFALLLGMITITTKPASVEAAAGDSALNNYFDGDQPVVRGVMQNINDLPQVKYQNANPGSSWKDLKVGTANRPFFILELVPYEEYGEFGYFIGGCEPIALENAGGNVDILYKVPYSMHSGIVEVNNTDTYFFDDEPESKTTYYGRTNPWPDGINSSEDSRYLSGITVCGYYQVVEPDTGHFKIDEVEKEDGTKAKVIVKEEGGNLIWHTMNDVEKKYSSEKEFNQLLSGVRMEKVGDKLYTKRKSTDEDKIIKVDENSYYFYKNEEVFLKDVIGLTTEKQINSFSVVYKAITTEELNDHPEWADYADLIYLNCGDMDNGAFEEKHIEAYNMLNRLGHTWNVPSNPSEMYEDSEDLTYNSVMKIFNKVTADTNYAGLLVDALLFDAFTKVKIKNSDGTYSYGTPSTNIASKNGKYLTALIKNQKTYRVYDYNLKSFDSSVLTAGNQVGVCNNFYKLILMTCTTNTNIVKNVFLPHMKCARITFSDTKNYSGFALSGMDDEKLKDDPDCKIVFDGEYMDYNGAPSQQGAYWWDGVFQLVDRYTFLNAKKPSGGSYTSGELYNYLQDNKDFYWKNYYSQVNKSYYTNDLVDGDNNTYVNGRVYYFNSNKAIAQGLRGAVSVKVGASPTKFSDFNSFLSSDEGTKRIWNANNPKGDYSTVTANTAPPSAALRYILGLGTLDERNNSQVYHGELNVLDIEPATDLDDLQPKWALKESYFYMILPNFDGKIHLTHYTMPAFNGKVDDLNSDFDLIYLGADLSGFRTGKEKINNKEVTVCPDFYNDDDYDNKIYYHVGDTFEALFVDRDDHEIGFYAKFMSKVNGKYPYQGKRPFDTLGDSTKAREPGNDITKVKIGGTIKGKKIETNNGNFYDYMEAGYPIVAEPILFEADRMDANSNMWYFIDTYDYTKETNPLKAKDNGVLKPTDAAKIEQCIRNNSITVRFDVTPRPYSYTSYNTNTFNDPNIYLPVSGGTSYLRFRFYVDNNPQEYSYKFYVDQDRNGKFDTTDVVIENTVNSTMVSENYPLASTIVGVIQWRLEVYKTDYPNRRVIKEGFSAARNLQGESAKKELRVLQVKPRSDRVPTIDMTTDAYKKWYNNLDAFDVKVDIITWDQFNAYFKTTTGNKRFKYDMGTVMSDTNPANVDLAESAYYKPSETADPVLKPGLPEGSKDLTKYNMLIFGFDDMYGNIDMTNEYGAVEYIYYFAMCGWKGSVMFTHDTTSMFTWMETRSDGSIFRSYGSTSNVLMRDVMGMNRFGVSSSFLANTTYFRSGLASELTKYRTNRINAGLIYDSTVENENQGLTFASLKNMGVDSQFTLKNMGKVKSLVSLDSSDDYTNSITLYDKSYDSNKGDTSKIQNLNRGQISEYPYNIPEIIDISPTHPQLYQLNMEDPELNVWYTLYPSQSGGGCKELIAASPQDAANSYYIYSKGNIFYTGVGHCDWNNPGGVNQPDLEKQLFVNTMIAAYRASYTAPTVKVTNSDAVTLPFNHYSLAIPQEFNYDASKNLSNENFDGNTVTVYFSPMDYNFSNDIGVWIYFGNDSENPDLKLDEDEAEDEKKKKAKSILTVYDSAGNPHEAKYYSDEKGTGMYIPHLKHGHVYHFEYSKNDLPTKYEIAFRCINDRSIERGDAYLKLYAEPLFLLD